MVMKEAVVRGRILLGMVLIVGCMAAGEEIFPTAFWGNGNATGQAVWVSASGFAHWEFLSLPTAYHHLVLKLTTRAAGEDVPVIPVCLRIFTLSLREGRAFRLKLRKVSPGTYFGQLCLSRRDLKSGSQLAVRLTPYPVGVELGLDRHSLTLQLDTDPTIAVRREQEYSGWLSPAGGPQATPVVRRPAAAEPTLALPETEKMQDAVYIAPGTYAGELGWAGPGSPPDMADWFKVNLLPGQLVRVSLQAQAGVPCTLKLCAPAGNVVAELRAGNELALEYRVEERGPWLLGVIVSDHSHPIHYKFSLEIRP